GGSRLAHQSCSEAWPTNAGRPSSEKRSHLGETGEDLVELREVSAGEEGQTADVVCASQSFPELWIGEESRAFREAELGRETVGPGVELAALLVVVLADLPVLERVEHAADRLLAEKRKEVRIVAGVPAEGDALGQEPHHLSVDRE